MLACINNSLMAKQQSVVQTDKTVFLHPFTDICKLPFSAITKVLWWTLVCESLRNTHFLLSWVKWLDRDRGAFDLLGDRPTAFQGPIPGTLPPVAPHRRPHLHFLILICAVVSHRAAHG